MKARIQTSIVSFFLLIGNRAREQSGPERQYRHDILNFFFCNIVEFITLSSVKNYLIGVILNSLVQSVV
jgi:hypothetical protein